MRMTTRLLGTVGAIVVLMTGASIATAQYCGPSVLAPQCDGQCPYGQMCADTGSGCACQPATSTCANPTNPNGPPVCWGACPSATMVCATFAGGCTCVQGPVLCGNGTNDPGELCEDGNTVSGDGCDENCTPTGCGNGVATAGEECDGTDNGACSDGCALDCTCAAGPATSAQTKCFFGIAKAAGAFVKARLKLVQACREQDLKAPGTCGAPDPLALAALESKLDAGLAKVCALGSADFDNMGFPGRCPDANPLDGFTTSDLQACIRTSHGAAVDQIAAVEYDPTLVGPLVDPAEVRCQQVLGKFGAKMTALVLKGVQSCRNAILKGKIAVPPAACAGLDPKTAAKILKVATKTQDAIFKSCTDAAVANLKVCTPDQLTASTAASCITAAHVNAVDDPIVSNPADLIDYEYATPPVCGDHDVNQTAEVCDGPDDAACPGLCEADCTCP